MTLPAQKGMFVDDKVIADAEDKVRAICEEHPECANSDAELLARYWLAFDKLDTILRPPATIDFILWMKKWATPAETITRARRAIRKEIGTSGAIETVRQEKAGGMTRFYRKRKEGHGN